MLCRQKDEPGERPTRVARTFHNPLIAEAAALAQERKLLNTDSQDPSTTKPEPNKEGGNAVKKGKSRWMDEDEDNSPLAAEAGNNKRRRSPIVWNDQSKQARTENGAPPAAPSSRPMTMAERAQAEVEEFRKRQAELAAAEEEAAAAALAESGAREDQKRYLGHSPDISSPEEEMHIRREGTSAHDLREDFEKEEDEELEKETRKKDVAEKKQPTAAQQQKEAGLDDLDDLEDMSDDNGDNNGSEQYHGMEVEEQEEEEVGVVLPPEAGPARPPPLSDEEDGFVDDGYPEVDDEYITEGYPEPEDIPEEEEEREERREEEVEREKEENKNKNEEGDFIKRSVSMLNECRSVEHYEKLNRISEGTYGVVYRARDRETGQICALKKVKLEKERDGFPLTSVREINVLLSLTHPSIVNVSEVVVGSSLDAVFMVMEYADHDLKAVMDKRMHQPFTISEVKCLMHQLLSGIAYLHGNWVIHRDLKTSNILYTNKGQLKICDFGLARQYGEPLKPYTQLVVTLWYRSPELLLGAKTYSTGVDVWSCGCIMAELLAKRPLFMGQNELSQLDTIFRILGCPTSETWPGIENLSNFKKFNFKGSRSVRSALRGHFPAPGPVFDGKPTLSDSGFDLLQRLLELCPEKRISAQDALDHPWFREHPLPKDPAMMPTFPSTNESLHRH
jgi:cell division cycle 2-like protein